LSVTNENGDVTWYAYDALNRTTVMTDALGSVTNFGYDALGNRTLVIDALGQATQYAYDTLQRPVTITDALGSVTTFTYDALGHQLTAADRAGRVTRTEYDALGRTTAVTVNYVPVELPDADTNVTTQYTYDVLGRRIAVEDANGHVTHQDYDALGRVTVVTDSLNHTTTFTYDGLGQRLSITNGEGEPLDFVYDGLGRVVLTRNVLGHETTYRYDGLGNRVAMVDANGVETRYGYDPMGRLTTAIENYQDGISNGAADEDVITSYNYDAVGNRTAITNALGYVTAFTYDALQRQTAEQDPLGHTTRYGYDSLNNQTVITNANGAVTTFDYDALGHLETVDYPAGQSDVTFSYSIANNREQMVDASGTTTSTYDDLGRLTSVTDGANQTVSYNYNPMGQRTALIFAGQVVSYTYDAVNRLEQVQDWNRGFYSYTYDAANRLTGLAYPNGVTSHYIYDDAGRLINLNHATGSQVLANYHYILDDAGNRSHITETLRGPDTLPLMRTISYDYDPLYRLTQATYSTGEIFAYTYDMVGNRTHAAEPGGSNRAYNYDAANRLTDVNGVAYTWDANGNLLSDGTSHYSYDAANRLIQVTQGSITSTYQYDGIGNRLAQTVGGVTTRYALDVAAGLPEVIASTTGASTTHYLQVGGQLLAQHGAGTSAYVLPDHLGSVRQLVEPTGDVMLAKNYQPFGEVLDSAGSGSSSFGFTGELVDATGLVYLRARYYEPQNARFVTQDTWQGIVERPSSLNKWVYVEGNPTNQVDPTGHFPISPSTWDQLLPAGEVVASARAAYSMDGPIGSLAQNCHRDDGQHLSDTVIDVLIDYVCEWGPSHRLFNGDAALTKELAHSPTMHVLRTAFYQSGGRVRSGTYSFGVGEFILATLDAGYAYNLSLTHFMGSFDYKIAWNGAGKTIFMVDNDTTLESGTRLPPPVGIHPLDAQDGRSVESIIRDRPDLAHEHLYEVLWEYRGQVISILEPLRRGETTGRQGGGTMKQTFLWQEEYQGCFSPLWPHIAPFLSIERVPIEPAR
jgi:RHS repeat-associated protein